MLFRKKIDRSCSYCKLAGYCDETHMACQRYGIVPKEHHCRRFKYDPLKRIPVRPNGKSFEKFKNEDFSL